MNRSILAMLTCIAAFGFLVACEEPEPERSAETEADVAAIRGLLDTVEQTFNDGDLDGAMTVFTDDAKIIAHGQPDVTGADAIRAMYTGMFDQFEFDVDLTSDEINIVRDLAYERGNYTLRMTDKASGEVVSEMQYRHIHIFKRQFGGGWKTWRMMVNSAEAAVAQ